MDIGSIGMLWIGVTIGACIGALAMGVLTGRREPIDEETHDEVTA